MPLTTVTVGGIDAGVFCDGYRKGNDNSGNGPWREVIYDVAWGDSDDFMDALMGINTPVVSGGTVVFPIPHQYPGNAILFCAEVWGEPVGTPQPDPKLFAADRCHVHAVYRVPKWDIPGTDSQNSFGGEPVPWGHDNCRGYTFNYPANAAKFTGVTTAFVPTVKPDYFVPHVDFVRTRSMIPYLYFPVMVSLVGCVNVNVMWGFDVGTLMFETFDTDKDFQPDGTAMQQIVQRFTWRPWDWNAVPHDDDMTWEVIRDGSGNYRYPYQDLTVLFSS